MIWFCSSTLPLGGILISTCTPASFSYLWTPAAAIFQNSRALLVTKASFRGPEPALSVPLSRLQPRKRIAQTDTASESFARVFIEATPYFHRGRTQGSPLHYLA